MQKYLLLILLLLNLPISAVSTELYAKNSRSVDADTDDSQAENSIGEISAAANLQGITIINNRVYIDNIEIPPEVKRYKSSRTGEVYLINRRGTNVTVQTAAERKK